MLSLNNDINALHSAYCVATGYDIPLLATFERSWWNAQRLGLSPAMVIAVIRDRQRRVREGVRHKECLLLRNIAGTEDTIAEVICEAAALKALERVHVMDPAKAEVLASTGRVHVPVPEPVRSLAEVIEAMRKAAS